MREFVMSSDEVDETAEEITTAHGDGRRPEGLMRWEKFLPKIALRVLLVESDDSTSQIVAALLRKCNYKVAAVSDGLKAWEIIKGRPHNIDLILTEVYLPSISGYALLTLIMEHEICKNIPVIMMSSQDSVSTVYKCMLKGAADYLVKPLRKNELRNLWQHVWRRRQSLRANANSPQEESVGQQKLEAASENNSTSNQASGIKRDEDQNEKGSEAESSCAKQDMEVESGDMENLQSLSEKKDGMQGTVDNVNPRIVNDDVELDRQMDSARNISRKAFDFMGAFRSDRRVTDHETSTIKSALGLDLSLRRCNHISNPYPSSGEKSNFRSSSASAFTRYVNRPIQTECALSPNTSNVNREVRFQQNAGSSETARYSNSKAPVPPNIRSSETPWRNKSSVCNSIPAKDIRFENNKTPIAVNCSSIFITQSSPSTTPSRCSSSPHEPSSSLHPFQPPVLEKGESGRLHNQLDGKRDHKPDTLYDKQNVTVTADGFSNGICFASTSGRSNISNVDHLQVPATGTNAENKTEHGVLSPSGGGKSQRSIQREAVLAKFRMKRKDRCFEKKVRYESRKKLAEQRPRVKGQFVRQVNTEHVSAAEEEAETPTATRQNFA